MPFARSLSNIWLFGDAWHWWSAAAGRYNRGHTPQVGSILSFRPDLRMPLGHVAVVTRIIGARLIEVDHANWAFPGAISLGVQVVDVSENNDWTLVHVELPLRDHFGYGYATDGFIYGRPLEPGPQIMKIADMFGDGRHRPQIINVAEALRFQHGAEIINVTAALRGLRAWPEGNKEPKPRHDWARPAPPAGTNMTTRGSPPPG